MTLLSIGLGLRCAEYTIPLISKFLNKDYFEVTVVSIKDGGDRMKLIQETDVFYWRLGGVLNPELFAVVKANKPKLVLISIVARDQEKIADML